jgi:hypothetical protein
MDQSLGHGHRPPRLLPWRHADLTHSFLQYTHSVIAFTIVRLRRACWLALVAMLSLALAPAVSHGLAAWRGQSGWVEVCTTQGMRWITAGESGRNEDAPAPTGAPLEACSYCTLSFGAAGMPPAPATGQLLPLTGAEAPPLLLEAPLAHLGWRNPQPRAPPPFA